MRSKSVATGIRLTATEQEQIRQKAIEINKLLVKRGLQPMKDSELVHKILEKSVPYAVLSESGEIIIDAD